nr:uncharacterized protein LOC105843331 [Hydra vulgaris]
MELVRDRCSLSLGAALGNALLRDIKHLLLPEVDIDNILMDKCKLDRAKSKIKIISINVELEEKKQLFCIGLDGKIDNNTKMFLKANYSERKKFITKCVAAEHHLTFTHDNGKSHGIYLTHRAIPVVGASGDFLALETFSVLEEYYSLETIGTILLDNIASNTGWRSGLVVNLEELIGRKLHTIGCSLHQNELPLKALFKKLDGKTTGPQNFSGPIGILKKFINNLK